MSEAGPLPGPRATRWAALAVLAVLLATVHTRAFGLIPDGKEMLSASAAISRFLEIGVSRDFVNAPRRPGGDAVSRYGMGLSLAEAVPGALMRVIRTVAPSAPSAPVFVLLPIACLVAAAWATTRALLLLGATPAWAATSGAGLVLATPLWGSAASDYSEPLQACCIALLLLAVVELRDAPVSRRWQIVAGVAAGFAVLTKTLLLIAVAPLVVYLVFEKKRGTGSRRRAAATDSRRPAPPWPLLLSFAGILFLWVAFERVVLVALFRRDARLAFASALSSAALLFAASAWWAWDGQAGWEPRLLLPALPPLVFLAGLACASSGRPVRIAGALALFLGFGVNLLGALVPFPAVYRSEERRVGK